MALLRRICAVPSDRALDQRWLPPYPDMSLQGGALSCSACHPRVCILALTDFAVALGASGVLSRHRTTGWPAPQAQARVWGLGASATWLLGAPSSTCRVLPALLAQWESGHLESYHARSARGVGHVGCPSNLSTVDCASFEVRAPVLCRAELCRLPALVLLSRCKIMCHQGCA